MISVRNTIHGLETLATHASEVYEILCLSRAQALDLFPACKDWLPAVQDPAAAELILTPLILSHFRSPSDQKIKASRLTQTGIMGQAIRALLGRSHLVGVRTKRGDVIDLQHLSVALALLAWLFFYKARGEIEAALVPEEAAGIRRSWERFLQQHRPNRDTILIGFALVEDADTCAFLLQRTVFLPTSSDTYRFVHRSWQEFLLAQYFALCLERACFVIRRRSPPPPAYRPPPRLGLRWDSKITTRSKPCPRSAHFAARGRCWTNDRARCNSRSSSPCSIPSTIPDS